LKVVLSEGYGWLRPDRDGPKRLSQNRSQGSLYLQSRPYLAIMRISHLQMEICIEGAFKISKMMAINESMLFIVVVIVIKICL